MKIKSLLIFSIAIIVLTIGIIGIYKIVKPNEYLSYNSYEFDINNFNDAEYFIKYGYPEIKTLSIRLLTLLSAILVFSITFSEKIVRFNKTNQYARLVLFISWTYFILAIIADGFGLAFNTFALPYAIVDNHYIKAENEYSADFYEYSAKSVLFIIISGFLFISGLISILISGILANYNTKSIKK